MKIRRFVIAALFGALCSGAHADDTIIGGGVSGMFKPSAGGYTGILDIASIPTVVMSFGAHCPKSSYTGNLIDVADNTGTVQATLKCNSGGVIAVTVGSTWSLGTVQSTCATSGSCFALKMYDTSGALSCTGGTACDTATLTTTTAPYLVFANGTSNCGSGSTFAKSGTFCLQTNTAGGQGRITSAALNAGISQPITYLFTYATLSVGSQEDLVYNSGNTVRCISDTSATTLASFAGSTVVTVTAAEAQWHTAFCQFNGASSYLQADNGTASTTNPGTSTIASGNTMGVADNTTANDPYFGFIGDVYIFSGSINSVASTVYSNEKAFWGGGMP